MEQFDLAEAPAKVSDQNIASETARLEVKHSSGCLRAEIFVREGTESLFSVYSITGQLRFRKQILNPGPYEFSAGLKKGVYVATLNSGKNWTAKRIIVQ